MTSDSMVKVRRAMDRFASASMVKTRCMGAPGVISAMSARISGRSCSRRGDRTT